MPKITVREKDLSWYRQQSRTPGAMTVYVPGLSTFGPYDPTVVTQDTFESTFGGTVGVVDDFSFYIAGSYLAAGFDVLFHRIPLPGATTAKAAGKFHIPLLNNTGSSYEVTAGVTIEDGATEITCDPADANTIKTAFATWSTDPGTNSVKVEKSEEEGHLVVTPNSTEWYIFSSAPVCAGVIEGSGTCTIVYRNLTDTEIDVESGLAILSANTGCGTTTAAGTASDVSAALARAGVFALASDSSDLPIYNFVLEISAAHEFNRDLTTEMENNYIKSMSYSSVVYYDESEDFYSPLIEAKYEGTYGNSFKIKVNAPSRGTESPIRYFYVYDQYNQLLETLVVDFEDPTSANYYEYVDSKYIKITLQEGQKFNTGEWVSNETLQLAGGQDMEVNLSNPRAAAYNKLCEDGFFDDLVDPYLYKYDIITSGGFTDTAVEGGVLTPKELEQKFLAIAKEAGNAIYFVSGQKDMTADEYYSYCDDFDSSYAVGVGPFFVSVLIYNGVRATLPGYYATILAWADSAAAGNPTWFAPAGVVRANVGPYVIAPTYPVGNAVLTQWQNHPTSYYGEYKVNPIMRVKQYGYCVYGNSTLLHSRDGGASSLLQSLGTRVLVNQIKTNAFDVALGLQFDQIAEDLFVSFKGLLSTYLDSLVYNKGIGDYAIILNRSAMTDEDLNNKRIPVIIKISPNPAAEDFDITCEVHKAGVTFTDI